MKCLAYNRWWYDEYRPCMVHSSIVGVSLSEPHINVMFVKSACLSVCPYIHDTIIYKYSSNLWIVAIQCN